MEGSYKVNRSAYKTAEDAEAGTITNSRSLEKDQKAERNESRLPKMYERRFPGFTKNLYEYFVEYSSNTTIQGISYMGERSRPIIERLAWVIFFCMSLYFCISLIIQSYKKWETSPVLVSFSTSPTTIWKIPFPAVTICPETKTQKSIFNYTDYFHKMKPDYPANITEEERKRYYDVAMLCERESPIEDGNATLGYDTIEFLNETAPDFSRTFWFCEYPFSNEICQDFFTPILTEEGICYTFNMLDRNEVFRDNVFFSGDFMSNKRDSGGWTVEGGYKENNAMDSYPRRAAAAGYDARFFLFLRTEEQDLDYVCNSGVQGYKIILHNPSEPPRLGLSYYRLPHHQDMMLTIIPKMMSTSEGLKNYDPHIRRCYFSEERYLAFYRSYSQANCEDECLTNFTLTKCGCAAYQMPYEKETPICGPGNMKCMNVAKNELLRREFLSSMDKKQADLNSSSGCDCLPECISLVYNAETSQADWDYKQVLKGLKMSNSTDFRDGLFTAVHILFKEQHFITMERNELYGGIDFLSSCGGILGLFTGFSFLSLVEIIYFLSLRLFCNVIRYGKHYWSGSQELLNSDKYDHKK